MTTRNNPPPNHRYELTLTWGCNSWGEMLDRIDEWILQQRINYPDELEFDHKGFGGGYSYEVKVDHSMTDDRFKKELAEWMKARKSDRI